MKVLFVLVQLGAAIVRQNVLCAALAVVLFTTLIENLRLCSSAEAEIVLKF